MAINGEVELTWGDADYKFNIAKVGQILELEEKCGCGIAEVFGRIRDSKWRINDLRETIRLGLIGAGTDPSKALILVKRYVDDRPLIENVQFAMVILMAALVGVKGDDVGKKQTAERAKETPSSAAMADTSAPQSTDWALRSDGTPVKQTN